MAPPQPTTGRWSAYLARFHADRPGITETILGRCRSDGDDPYDWVAEPLRGARRTLDVASGSGPLADRVTGWIGLDAAHDELRTATGAGRHPVVRGGAGALPVRSGTAESVACSMGLQIIEPLDGALAEIARALAPLGRASLLLPATRPVPPLDALVYLRLQVMLRARIRYPNDRRLARRRLVRAAAHHGLRVVTDERRAFLLPIDTPEQGAELVRSLYLPGVPAHRLERAARYLGRRVGSTLTVPLRRVVLEPASTPDEMAPLTRGVT